MKKKIYAVIIALSVILSLGIAGSVAVDVVEYNAGLLSVILVLLVGCIGVFGLNLECTRDSKRIHKEVDEDEVY